MIVSLISTVYFLRLKAENTAVTLSWSWLHNIRCYIVMSGSIVGKCADSAVC